MVEVCTDWALDRMVGEGEASRLINSGKNAGEPLTRKVYILRS